MKKALFQLLCLAALLLFSGCPINKQKKYPTGIFPEQATNFADVNSPYDDYNSALPETHVGHKLIFSSNRNSQGDNYDIVDEDMHIIWFQESGDLLIDNSRFAADDEFISPLLQLINTASNEFGPLSMGYENINGEYGHERTQLITFSTNHYSDDYASFLSYYRQLHQLDSPAVVGPIEIKIINHYKNAQYLSFFGESAHSINIYNLDPASLEELYFQADTNGQTDIYKIDIPANNDFIGFLTADTNYPAQIVELLSTSSNDKCPFINGKTMVFTSDRPGGFGGYDLYYTLYENGQWQEPVNFGEKINSAYDEFRPVTLFASGFATDLLIFSSNRPEGQGGFDIYYAALPFKVFDWNWMDI